MTRGAPPWLLAAGVLALAGGARPVQARQSPFPSREQPVPPAPATARPALRLLRTEEDWSPLREPALRRGGLDRLKYLPLDADGRAWLTLGADLRLQWERIDGEDFGTVPDDRGGYLLARAMAHADVQAGRLRGFVQLKSSGVVDRAAGARPVDRDDADVHQAFAELRAAAGAGRATLRAGRFELQYGSSRLIAVREAPNVRLAFQGVLARVEGPGGRIDAFFTAPVDVDPGAFDDGSVPGERLWGIHGSYPVSRARWRGTLDIYYLGLRRDDAAFASGVGAERRHSVGVRLAGAAGAFDHNVELVGQVGRFGARRIRAWTVASDVGVQLRGVAGRPRLSLRADIASGDGNPDDGTLGTFNPLFPRGAYFGQLAAVGPQNFMDVHPRLEWRPARAVDVALDWLFYWRHRRTDGLYDPPGNVLRPAAPRAGRFVGHQPAVEATVRLDAHASLFAHLARFVAAPALEQTPPARSISYLTSYVTWRF